MGAKVIKLLQWLQEALEEESALLLAIIAISVLFLETLDSLGLWSLPWFRNQLAEITLTFLLVFALGVVSQQRLQGRQIGELGKTIAAQAGLSAKLKAIGIIDLWAKDSESLERRRDLLKGAKTLAVASVSAYTWIYANTDLLRSLLLEKDCHMRILLATPESDFVALREEREGEHRRKAISAEINSSVGLLKELVLQEASTQRSTRKKMAGTLEIRFCRSDIPARVEIVNDTIIHWTPHILPARTSHMPAFEVQNSADPSASKLLLEFFEMLWKESESATVFKWPTL